MEDGGGVAEGVDDLLGLMWHAPRPLNTLWCPCGCGYKGDARVPQGALRDAVSLDEFLKCVGVRAKRRQKFVEQYSADSSKFWEWMRVAAHHVGSSPPSKPRRLVFTSPGLTTKTAVPFSLSSVPPSPPPTCRRQRTWRPRWLPHAPLHHRRSLCAPCRAC